MHQPAEPLSIAVRYHHCPSQSGGSKLADIVHVADCVAMMAGLGLGIDGTYYQMENQSMDKLDLKEEDINDVMQEVIEATLNISA